MNVRKTVKKIAALSGGALMVGATMMGAMAYDLAEYPAPFIADGVFDGAIVVGAAAATQDVLGSIDIAASLQAMSVTEEAVDVPGLAGEVNLGENSFRFEASNDLLEIREAMGNIYDSLTDAELDALAGGTITTDEGSTDYNQYLNFDDGTGAALEPIGVNYAEDKYDNVGDFLVIDNDASFFEWEITFNEGLESDVEDEELVDLEDEVFNIFGTDFTFVNSNTDGTEITLEFMSGDVSSTLREGETKTFTIDGVEYEVTLIFVSDPSGGSSDPEAKFMVNGEVTDSMQDGDTDTLSGGFEIGVRDLLVNSREGVVEFFLGAEKVSFYDPDGEDGAYTSGSQIEVGSEEIDNAEVMIEGTFSTTAAEISSIMYRLEANPTKGSVFYIPPGSGVREFMEEPEALLSPTFDLRYEGLKSVATSPVEIDTSGDDQYEITVTNMQNKEFNWPLINDKDQVFRFGEEDESFVFVEAGFDTDDHANATNTTAGSIAAIAAALNDTMADATTGTLGEDAFNIWQDDIFIVSDVSKLEKANSYALTYDTISTSENTITFSDLDDGKYKIQYTPFSAGTGDVLGYSNKLRVGGNTYNLWILNEEDDDYPVAIDLNNDGFLGDGDMPTFTVKGGGILNFANAATADGGAVTDFRTVIGHGLNVDGDADATNDDVDMVLTTLNTEFDTTGMGDETVTWTVSADADDELDISTPAFTEPTYLTGADRYNTVEFISEDTGDLSHTYTSYGAYVTLDEPSGSPATFVIDYPESQVGAQVFVVAGSIQRSESGTGVTREVVNPISVGLAVLDSDAPALGSANLIVVGGPCANTVAAEIMGNPANCAEGFVPGKAMIKSVETNGKVAILVAGYEAQETQGASYVLANYGDYAAFQGEEVEVVVPDLSNIVVQAVTAAPMDDGTDDDMDEQ